MTKEEKYETNEIELKDIPTDWFFSVIKIIRG